LGQLRKAWIAATSAAMTGLKGVACVLSSLATQDVILALVARIHESR